MLTNIPLNVALLEYYPDFEKANPGWSLLSYITMKFDINTALALSKLFFPDFIAIDNCIVVSYFFNEASFREWQKELNGDIPEIEKMCNLYEIKDFFHINSPEIKPEQIKELSLVLKKSWEINLSTLFPNRKMKVDIFEQTNSTFITLYSILN